MPGNQSEVVISGEEARLAVANDVTLQLVVLLVELGRYQRPDREDTQGILYGECPFGGVLPLVEEYESGPRWRWVFRLIRPPGC